MVDSGYPKSLAISPNLDALLEYDQRTREPPKPASTIQSLPPPPRKPRKATPSPVQSSNGSLKEVPIVNPWINASPSFASSSGSGWSKSASEDSHQGVKMSQIQHVRQPSVNSTVSSDSGLEEHRISISSTVRFASSQGHSRLSFIDLVDDNDMPSPKSFMSFQETKPPLPTSPKPDFSNRTSPRQADRADLIRKSRKLAQVFGKTPQASILSSQSFLDMHRVRRQSFDESAPVWPPEEIGTQYMTASGRRRHSTTPLTPELQLHSDSEDRASSYIDLSEDEDGITTPITPNILHGKYRDPNSPSFLQNFTPEELAEEERRKRLVKLRKLHRFLGSRVPTNLVLGEDVIGAPLPPDPSTDGMASNDETARKAWMRRRRSSSAAAFPSSFPDELVRLKEDLNEEEKAINVRRAVKMEKLFGQAPPQTLYHTRHTPSLPVSKDPIAWSGSHAPPLQPLPPYRNKSKKDRRPGTADSSQQLIPKSRSSDSEDDNVADLRTSIVYTHYQHSLNSLNDILDRDDKESLAELHQYLNGNDTIPVSPLVERRLSLASIKSERRRSLPARTSNMSLASEYTSVLPKPDVTDFQLRRRRAAKLTQFFGVDYRDLIRDVLDSIENGLEHEQRRGTINSEEAELLLKKLRALKTKRPGIF